MRLKRSGLVATLAGALVMTGAVAKAAEVVHQTVDSTFVQALAGENFNSAGISAFRNDVAGPDGSPQYFLTYNAQNCDGGYPILTCTGVRGYGNVPGGAVQANATTARVSVDTSTVAGFTNTSYQLVLDFSGGGDPVATEVDSSGPGGLVQGQWSAKNQFHFSESGTNSSTSGAFTLTTVGTLDSNGAIATGSVLGTPFTAPFASLGTTHHVQLMFTRQ